MAQNIDQLVAAIAQLVNAMGNAPAQPNAPAALSKLSTPMPSFEGKPQENIVAWLLQVETIFSAQGINDENKKILFACTGLKGAALHWHLNKVIGNNNTPPYTGWDNFQAVIKAAFQPPNFQQHLWQQLKKLKQTGSVLEYTTQFQNLVGQAEGMGNVDQVMYYIEGLKPATRMEIAYQAPATLEAAVAQAIKYDTAMYGK